ncbi:MAG: hypothetical protein HOF43_07610, partial [Chloroflexi bacterium]|nr:hypothetical protein [Chloroflexota bacterium]
MGAATTLMELVRAGARVAGQVLLARSRADARDTVERSNRASRVLVDQIGDDITGFGGSQTMSRYGDFYSTSAAVHAAVRVRASAVA